MKTEGNIINRVALNKKVLGLSKQTESFRSLTCNKNIDIDGMRVGISKRYK